MKHQTINLVKFKALSKLLGCPQWQVVGLLESLWLFCQHNARDGVVSRFTNLEIGAWLEYDGDANELIEALITTRWLDRDSHGNVSVHDWLDHMPNWLKGIGSPLHPKQTKSKPNSKPSSKPSLEPPSLTLPNLTQDPPSPSPTQPACGSESEWGGVVDNVAREGVGGAYRAVNTARDNGATLEDVRQIAEYFKTIRHRLDKPEACFYNRILNWRPGQQPSDGWPFKKPQQRDASQFVQRQPRLPPEETAGAASIINTAMTGGMI